jgi:hypothetical protein
MCVVRVNADLGFCTKMISLKKIYSEQKPTLFAKVRLGVIYETTCGMTQFGDK